MSCVEKKVRRSIASLWPPLLRTEGVRRREEQESRIASYFSCESQVSSAIAVFNQNGEALHCGVATADKEHC